MKTKFRLLVLFLTLSACGAPPSPSALNGDESCATCSEKSLNAPVSPDAPANEPAPVADQNGDYRLPTFDSAWGLSRALFEEMRAYYEANRKSIPNQRFVTIVDFNLPSSKPRLFLFNLATGTVERRLVAHGAGSDPQNTGYATRFSNEPNSRMSSLGFYLTLGTYQGGHGYSLHLRGLSSTNSNAEARAVVMHPASYVSEASGHAGRSWGCPALDPAFSRSIIERVRNGSLLLIGK